MNIKTFKGGFDCNFSYLVWEKEDVILIDPSTPADEILKFIFENKLNLIGVFIMHSHFDHLVDLDKYKTRIFAHESSPKKDKALKHNQNLKLAGLNIKVLHTPGHHLDSICLLIDNNLFTSDTLFIECIGRTDLEESNEEDMKKSLTLLKSLPPETQVYPGHDYGSKPKSTIGYELTHNPYLR
jgi:hydroxyacylglutathione hydrolase